MTGTGPRDPRAVALLLAGSVAALLYANFVLDWVLRGFEGMDDVVSELEATGQPHAVLLRVTDVVCAVLVVALLPWVRAGLPRGPWREVVVWATVLFAIGASVAALVPTPCGPDAACTAASVQTQLRVHDLSSVASDTVLYVGVAAAWLATREDRTGLVPAHGVLAVLGRRGAVQRRLQVRRQQRGAGLGGGRGPARAHPLHQRLDRCPGGVRRHRRPPRSLAAGPGQRSATPELR